MHDVPLSTTLLFALLLVAMILGLALEEKIHAKKSVIAGVFAALTLFLAVALGLVRPEAVEILGLSIELPLYVPGVDWEVIAIILGSSIFVDVTSKSGLFTWIAIKLTKASRGDPLTLLCLYGVMTVVFSAVLNNVTAMIIVGTLSGVSLGRLGQSHRLLGFLMVEGLLTNVGGLLTLVSSVPNIIVGSAAGISFLEFLVKSGPYVAAATALTLWLGARIFGVERLKTAEARAEAERLVAGFDENDGIESRGFFWFGAVMTALFIATIAGASVLPVIDELGLGYVALSFAVIALLRYKATADRFYQGIDWDLLGFFGCLFIVINMMEHALVLELIGEALAPVLAMGDLAGPGTLLVAAAAASSVTDNIPLAAMLAKILGGLGLAADSPYWWSVVFGANLGGNLTPIGSASTLVAVTVIHKNRLPLSFAAFVKLAIPFALAQLALAVAYVLLVLG
jgi:Na+/H+ antiporter NhaD/arsenite permease-like protein